MTNFTNDWIAKRRELEQAATEGPWRRVTARGTTNHALHDACDVDIAIDYEGVWYEKGDAEFIADARTSLPLALDVLEKVAKLHSPIAIYDECDCEDKSTPDHVTDHAMAYDIGPSCNYVYDACRECCGLTDGAGYWWMHERCSMHLYGHRHGTDEPICATRAAIESALGESLTSPDE